MGEGLTAPLPCRPGSLLRGGSPDTCNDPPLHLCLGDSAVMCMWFESVL